MQPLYSTVWSCPEPHRTCPGKVGMPSPERPGVVNAGPTIETAALLLIPCLMVGLALTLSRKLKLGGRQ
jgi:hypothetical protein